MATLLRSCPQFCFLRAAAEFTGDALRTQNRHCKAEAWRPSQQLRAHEGSRERQSAKESKRQRRQASPQPGLGTLELVTEGVLGSFPGENVVLNRRCQVPDRHPPEGRREPPLP